MSKFKKNILNITVKEAFLSLSIILLIIIVVVPLCMKHTIQKKTNEAKLKISLIEQAIISYKADTGSIPPTLDELLKNKSNYAKWNGPYLKSKHLKDPWDRDFIYESLPDQNYHVICYGADGNPGGIKKDIDITNRP
jgi:general secretion pathway protein G